MVLRFLARMSRAAGARILFWTPVISLMRLRQASLLLRVWAELLFQFLKGRPCRSLRSAGLLRGSAPGLPTLILYTVSGPSFSPHSTTQKGLNPRQRELVIARPTWVTWKLNSCPQAEEGGRE